MRLLTMGRIWSWAEGKQLIAVSVDARLYIFDLSPLIRAPSPPTLSSGGKHLDHS